MTKTIFAVSAILFSFFTACTSDVKESSTASAPASENTAAQKNLEASHVITKAFETGDLSMIDSAVASDFVDHTERGDIMGRDSLKAMIVAMRKESPDMKTEIIKEMADEDYVFMLMRITGTGSGAMGMPKGPYDFHAIQVVRNKDGKIVEHWEYMQPKEMMKMMPQGPPAKEDAKKKSK